MTVSKQNILNCSFDTVTETKALERARSIIYGPNQGYISTVNVAILMMMRSDRRLREFINTSSLIVADGQPIIWLSKLLNKPLPERVAGIDLCLSIAKMAAQEKKSIYLLGATDNALMRVETQLRKNNPDIIIAGRSNGYFGEDDAENRAKAVNESGADILFVAMGVPRQEYFVQKNWDKFGVKLLIGLGGSFDVIGGLSKRAPKWMQNYGLEWFFRLLQEPKRLAKRYAITNSKFLMLGFKEVLRYRFDKV